MSRRQHLKVSSRIIIALLAAVIIAVILGACSDPAPAPPTSSGGAVMVQPKPVVSAPTSTVQQQVEEKTVYAYNASGRRDPFAPIIEKVSSKLRSKDKPPLERFNISEFILSGIVWGGFGYNAILEGPDGKGYFVRVGTILGPNRGVVKKITQNTLIVEEKFKTFSGESERKEIVVEMRKKQEEAP